MIKILKEGKIPVKTKDIFEKKCSRCGCEFEFEMEDCDYISKSINNRSYSIACPFCKITLSGNHIYDLEHREVKVEE